MCGRIKGNHRDTNLMYPWKQGYICTPWTAQNHIECSSHTTEFKTFTCGIELLLIGCNMDTPHPHVTCSHLWSVRRMLIYILFALWILIMFVYDMYVTCFWKLITMHLNMHRYPNRMYLTLKYSNNTIPYLQMDVY